MDHGVRGNSGDRLDAGARVYEGMSNVQKQLLREYLSRELGVTTEWQESVSQRVMEVLLRRAQGGESLDAHDVIGEVLPFCRSIIPAKARVEIMSKIRAGTQRRIEESQRLRQLKQEKREELDEMKSDAAELGSSGYIPYILISLIFLSFPLSEPAVDWVLVACFAVLNGVWMLCFRSSSWLNWAMLVFANFTLVRLSHVIPELPNIARRLPPNTVATYVGVNVTSILLIYYIYVERRAPWAASAVRRPKRKRRGTVDAQSDESLEEFARRRDRLDRLDYSASAVLLANVIALVALGAIPVDVLLQSVSKVISFLQ